MGPMKVGRFGSSPAILLWLAAICLCCSGCESAQQKAADEQAASDAANAEAEAQSVAANSLGKESEVLLHGDLARNGHEEVLVANRLRSGADPNHDAGNSGAILVTRAALLEKNEGRWTELLRCDEHLKNADGYLGGFPKAPVTGWRLEYSQDANAGLEMKFAPDGANAAASASAGGNAPGPFQNLDVRWNKNTKRYQSFDRSHERYLAEIPILETPESSLR